MGGVEDQSRAGRAADIAAQREVFLTRASEILGSSLDYGRTLEALARLAVPAVADQCLVFGANGQLLTAAHRDAEDEGRLLRVLDHPRIAGGPVQRTLETGRPLLYREILDAEIEQIVPDADQRAQIQEIGPRSAVLTALPARGGTIGVLCLVMTSSGRRFDETDVAFAEELACRAAVAIDHAQLYASERQSRAAAERAALRIGRLLAVAADLAGALSSERVSERIIDYGVDALQASAGALWLLDADGTHLRVERLRGVSSGATERYGTIPLAGDAPVAASVLAGQPVFVESREEYARRYPASEQRAREGDGARVAAFAALPLFVEGRAIGAVLFSFAGARAFDPEERTFLSLLASQWAQALHRARLYEENERARRNAEALRAEAALLFRVTDAVARAQSLDAIYTIALDAVQATLDVRRASILLFDQDGVMRFKAWRGLSEAYREAVEGHSPWSAEDGDPAPLLIEDTELDPSVAQYRAIFQAERIRALAFIPLVHQRLLGKFMVYSYEPRRFAAREVQLAQTIAGQVAQAVTRQRLHDEERRLHREAQEAMRAREELISMASHDLRSPLSAVQLLLHSVLREAERPSDQPLDRAWIRERLGRASANIEKAVQLMDDLLDQARAAAGQLELHLAPVDLLAVVQDYTTRIGEQLDRAGCAATIHGRGPVVGRWDRLRIEQAFGNLLSNAMKYGAGEPIEITVEADEATARLRVRDHGIGIPEDAQARIFEPFRRATSEERSRSFGLGLWIVRQIVSALRGTIAVESAPGAGSAFTVTLPRGR